MKILDFSKSKEREELKQIMKDNIDNCDSAILILYDIKNDVLSHMRLNVSNYQFLAFLECIKFNILNEIEL